MVITNEQLLEEIRKIVFIDKEGCLSSREFQEIFPDMDKATVLNLPSYEIYTRMKEYEKKTQIKPGDIVLDRRDFITSLVLDDAVGMHDNDMTYLFNENGCVDLVSKKHLIKMESTNYLDKWVRKLQSYEPLK